MWLKSRGAIDVLTLDDAPAFRTAYKRFTELKPAARAAYEAGARRGIELLAGVEPTLDSPPAGRFTLALQADALGAAGDVRDVIVKHADGWELGILVKHNNDASKHPRLSRTLDFAAQWFGSPAGADYFAAVKPVFDELETYARTGSHWSALNLREAEKSVRFYRPVLVALATELRRQAARSAATAPALLRFMTGRRDFHKLIVSIKNRRAEIQAFNFDGTLGRGTQLTLNQIRVPRLPLPTRILDLDFKQGSSNTLLLRFDNSWALSLRLHSASSRIENSLKLDARLIEMPAEMLKLHAAWALA